MGALLGPETEPFLRALASPPAGLRVNTLRVSPERFRRIAPFALEPLAFPDGGFLVAQDARPGRHPYHAAGLYYLQDPGAMTVAALLDPRPGQRVIDLAAAPGGKATQLAALMGGRGVLIANDVHAGRARELAGNLERCGARNAVVTADSIERLAAHFGPWFDRVLLDAPCSGEAMFHKSGAARAEWSPAAVAGCARRQGSLIAESAALVRPGGRLVYATCTFSPEEDEEVVARFLDAHDDFELDPLPRVPGGEEGRPDWVPPTLARAELRRALRLWPHRVPGAGHFIAGLRRVRGQPAEPRTAAQPRTSPAALRLWQEFSEANLRAEVSAGYRLELRGDELYAVDELGPALERLRVLRPGWWLGTLRKNRFEPSHALALGLEPADVTDRVDLPAEAAEVRAYLRGETLRRAGRPGWLLVCVDDFPLGWGKRVGELVKNHYPKGLRHTH